MENGTKVGFQNGKITLPNGNKKEVILVTGGSGYLGLHLIEALAKGFSSQYDVLKCGTPLYGKVTTKNKDRFAFVLFFPMGPFALSNVPFVVVVF
jgi:nucleoside-diphosphate-sugar epimerase